MSDLFERIKAHDLCAYPEKDDWQDRWCDQADALLREAAAALEAEASEGERRGLEVERLVDFNAMLIRDNERYQEAGSALAAAALRVTSEFDGVHRLRLAASAWAKAAADEGDRALIPEAPNQPELASAAANQTSTPEVGLQEAPAREGELEAAAKAIFEQKGLHLSTGKAWERAIRSDRYYCLQYAEAVLIAIGRLPPPPPQDRQPDSQRGAK